MIHVSWQDQLLNVTRLIFQCGPGCTFGAVLERLASRLDLGTADDRTDPRPGDFWVGCHPRAGWGDADPELTGWASLVDVPLVVDLLRRTAAGADARPGAVSATPGVTLAVAFG